jgi:hypothetical protein
MILNEIIMSQTLRSSPVPQFVATSCALIAAKESKMVGKSAVSIKALCNTSSTLKPKINRAVGKYMIGNNAANKIL